MPLFVCKLQLTSARRFTLNLFTTCLSCSFPQTLKLATLYVNGNNERRATRAWRAVGRQLPLNGLVCQTNTFNVKHINAVLTPLKTKGIYTEYLKTKTKNHGQHTEKKKIISHITFIVE